MLPACRFRIDGFSIQPEADSPIDVGAEGPDFGGLQLLEHLPARMAVAVVQATGDHGPLRGHAGKKLGPRRTNAAVMANFEQGACESRLGQHRLFDGRLGIALQKHGRGAISHMQHHGVVVGRLCPRVVVRQGSQHRDLRAPQRDRITGAQRSHSDVKTRGLTQQRVVGVRRWVVAHPEFIGMEVAQNRRESAHVIGVGMAERHCIKVADAARPERRGDYLVANIELLRSLSRTATEPAAIHQQGFAIGRDEQQRVSLAHVDGFY